MSEKVNQKLLVANQNFLELIKKNSIANILEASKALHQSWLDKMKPLHQYLSQPLALQLHSSVNKTLCDISQRLALTEQFMTGISFEAISSRFQVKMSVVSRLESSIAQVATSYAKLTESLQNISDITRLPSFVLPSATREIFTTGIALKAFYGERERDDAETEIQRQLVGLAEQETSDCLALLELYNPLLATPYRGAREALRSNNPDRSRHVLVSLRELFANLLRELAPDYSVIAWIPGVANQKGLLDNKGKPTRRARVRYHCRNFRSDQLSGFVASTTISCGELFDLFNKIHKLVIPMNDEELEAIFLRTSSWLKFMLQIYMNNNHR